jgi:tetratricopeptide (TPR) repeat protein
MLVLRVAKIAVSAWCLCLVGMSEGSAQSPDTSYLHVACLVTPDGAQRVEACTAAINSKGLIPTLRADAFLVRASILLQQGHFDEARGDLNSARALGSSRNQVIDDALVLADEYQAAATTPAIRQRIELYRCQTEADPALRLDACDAVISASGGDHAKEAAAYALRAAARVADDDLDGAARDLERALELDPSKVFYRELRARVWYFEGEYSKSLAAYRRLEYQSSDAQRHPTIAALEYLVGDRARSVAFFRQAHEAAPRGNVFLLYAATVQSDLLGGDVAPFRELTFGDAEGPFAEALLAYRLGKTEASQLLASVQDVPFQQSQAHCMAQFHIGHRLALEEKLKEAALPFASATQLCPKTAFEYHAAQKWLKHLGQ